MRRALTFAALLSSLLFVVEAGEAHAQSAEERALARELFDEGVAHAQGRRWNEAVDAFSRSYAIAPRTPTLFNLASALTQAGRLLEARERYRGYVSAAEDEALRAEARRAIAAIEPRLGRLRVRIADLSPVDVVHLDTETLNHAALGSAIPADPGAHRITVTRGDQQLAAESVTVGEGEELAVDMALPPAALAPETSPTPLPATGDGPVVDENEEEESGGVLSSPWFWITLGVLVLAGGAVAAVLLVQESQKVPLYEGTTDPPSLGLP